MADATQVDFYDNFIDHFESQQDNFRNRSFREWAYKWIGQSGLKVLDFGCALGYHSGQLPLLRGATVCGIDLSSKCIEYAKQKYPEGKWYAGDILDGFDPGEECRGFDRIILSDVLEHVPLQKHEKLFQILSDWSDPNAAIIASVSNWELYDQIISAEMTQPVEEKVLIPDLLENMRKAGFGRVVSLFLFEDWFYRIIVQKVKAT
jgi:2-polyprenyl-3-methyl-5-hydroxy-6-metoxy-1,4-benzoquinol methylase